MLRAARRYNIQQLHALLAEYDRFKRLYDQTTLASIHLDELQETLEDTNLGQHPLCLQLQAYRQHLMNFHDTCKAAQTMVISRIERLFSHAP